MHRSWFSLFLGSAYILPALCRPGPSAKPITRVDEPLVLHPINLRDYESAVGLQRRGEDDFSDLDPKTQSQLIYGSPGSEYNVHIWIS